MSDSDRFLAAIAASPSDSLPRLVYADRLEESGDGEAAALQRFMSRSRREIDLPELLDDYDWSEVFGEGSGGNCTNKTDACPPGASIDCTPPIRADVESVLATVNGERDQDEWVGVFKLKDGRFLLATGSCDYTGWDCRAGNNLEVAASLSDILTIGLDNGQLKRLMIAEDS